MSCYMTCKLRVEEGLTLEVYRDSRLSLPSQHTFSAFALHDLHVSLPDEWDHLMRSEASVVLVSPTQAKKSSALENSAVLRVAGGRVHIQRERCERRNGLTGKAIKSGKRLQLPLLLASFPGSVCKPEMACLCNRVVLGLCPRCVMSCLAGEQNHVEQSWNWESMMSSGAVNGMR